MRETSPSRAGVPRGIRTASLALVLLTGCTTAAPVHAPAPAEFPALEAALAREPGDAERAVRLAAGYYHAGRLTDAATLLENTLTHAPAHAPSVLLLGVVYEELERYGDAREHYTRYSDADFSSRVRQEIHRRAVLLHRKEMRAAVQSAIARETELADTPPRPRTIAVFPFLYTGTDPALRPLSRALADMLTTDLAQTDRLQVLERMQVQMLVDEMELGESGLADPTTAARSGRLLGAERVVQGALTPRENDLLALEAAVVRVLAPRNDTGRTVTEADELERLFDLEKRLALDIYGSLGIQLTPAEIERVNQRPTQNVQALLAYGLGLEALDAGAYERAAEHFRQATVLDPSFDRARTRAAEAEDTEAASQTTTAELAGEVLGQTLAGTDELFAADLELPSIDVRDPVSEVLQTEGVGLQPTVLDIVIRRP